MPVSRETLYDIARELGFTSMGITTPNHALPLPGTPMKALPFEPRSIVALVMPTFKWADSTSQPDNALEKGAAEFSAAYIGMNAAYHKSGEWMERVRALDIQAERLSAIRAKTAALFTGLGEYRMNTLLYTREHGSYICIQVFGISALYEPDEPTRCGNPERADLASGCVGCRRCVNACPTGALDGKGGITVNKCLRFHMFSGKPTPVEYRRLMGRRLIGCDVCQFVCPMEPPSVGIIQREDWPWLRAENLLEPSAETLDAMGKAIGVNYARLRRVQAQAALIAGNFCRREYLPPLKRLMVVDDLAVSEHARWAAERIQYGCPE
ncbi:MAG: 4Fe-4S dicluster domain-containing protein [Oscillospiraceae bacterium]|jgi:epoxyqueuosine reductase|nr:4Fe-4S dicluster domain-containing protein [Oscillospiraceae bacterium]